MSYTLSVGEFASGVWEELGSPASPSIYSISGWFENHIGKLNILLDSCYTVCSGIFSPPLGNTESSLLRNIYEVDYFQQQTYKAINGIMDGTVPDWSRLTEADSTIVRSNRSELIKTFKALKKEAQMEVDKLVGYYKENLSTPIQVAGKDASHSSVTTGVSGF